MTGREKLVKCSRLILLRCSNSEKLCRMISELLGFCGYEVSDETGGFNSDFTVSDTVNTEDIPDGVIHDTAVSDGSCKSMAELSSFRRIVTGYSPELQTEGEGGRLFTYSEDNCLADLNCRNITRDGDMTVMEILSGGILSKMRLKKRKYTCDEAEICIAAAIAAGIPIASAVGFFEENG